MSPKKRKLPTASAAIKKLQSEGLASGFTPKLLKKLIEDIDLDTGEGVEASQVYQLLDAYYRATDEGQRDAFKEGYLAHDWRYGQETDDIIAEFCEILGKPSWFVLEKNDDPIKVRRDDGKTFDIPAPLNDVADFFNNQLKDAKDGRWFVALETDSDQHAYILVDQARYERLEKEGLLPISGTDYLVNRISHEEYVDWLATDKKDPLWSSKQLLKEGEQGQALQQVSNAVETFLKDPNRDAYGTRIKGIDAILLRAKLLFESGRFEDALTDVDSAVALFREPETERLRGPQAQVLKARALLGAGKVDESINAFNKAIEMNEWEPEAYYYRADAYAALKKNKESERDKEKAYSLGFRE